VLGLVAEEAVQGPGTGQVAAGRKAATVVGGGMEETATPRREGARGGASYKGGGVVEEPATPGCSWTRAVGGGGWVLMNDEHAMLELRSVAIMGMCYLHHVTRGREIATLILEQMWHVTTMQPYI
jgi:hypothetical protein